MNGLDIDNVVDIVDDAMSDSIVRTNQCVFVRYESNILVELCLDVHHWTDLEQIELACSIGVKFGSKLNFNGTTHILSTKFHRHGQQLRQWKHTVLKYTAESNHLASSFINAIANHLVVRVESRSNVLQGTILVCLTHVEFEQVETIVHLEILGSVLQVERIKMCLRLAQGYVHFTRLKHLVGMSRTYTQVDSTIHDVFAKTESKIDSSLLRLFVTNRIVIDTTCHTRNVRIEAVTILCTHHFLQNHRHLLLVDDIRGCSHIILAGTIEHRSIDALDGIAQHSQTHIFIFCKRNHVSAIDSGKWLIMRIFQK